MKEVLILISEVKEGNKESFFELIERFSPLIKKYVKLLYRNECEDVYSEMVLTLCEAVHHMKYYENEGQVITYISVALKNKFHLLYRKSMYEQKYVIQINRDIEDEPIQIDEQKIIEYACDIDILLNKFSNRRRNIYHMMIKDRYSDRQIATYTGVSRQYINRLRKELSREIGYINMFYKNVI